VWDIALSCWNQQFLSWSIVSSPWWWRQYEPLKRRSTSTRLRGVISEKAVIFIFAAVNTWNLTIPTLSTGPMLNMFPVANTSCVSKRWYHLAYCCHCLFLLRIRFAKCFANSRKRIQCNVMFENEHRSCSQIHPIFTRAAFAQLAWVEA
jgi:hypothetical protein